MALSLFDRTVWQGYLVEIFTDGACLENPGPGGWGAILRCQGAEKEISGSVRTTTNNRMELTAVIEALKALHCSCHVNLYTDSQYVQKGMSHWIQAWKKCGWKTAARKPVKNLDLWQDLEVVAGRHHIDWHWIRGHTGHSENERANALARACLKHTFLDHTEERSAACLHNRENFHFEDKSHK